MVALLIGSTFLRGFFSHEILRGFKLAALGLVLAGVGVWAYQAFPAYSAPDPVKAPEASPAPAAKRSAKAQALRESDRKALAAAMAEEAAKPDIPTHITAGGAVKPGPEKTRKGIVKSVGRALHLIPKTQSR